MEKPEELQTCRCNTFPGKDASAIKGLHMAILHLSFETQVSQEIPLSLHTISILEKAASCGLQL